MNPSPVHTALRSPSHAVQFYGNETSLFTTVAGFLGEGLVRGEPAVVIATPSHWTAIAAQLASRLINVEAATEAGDLVMLDAHETLATFLTDDTPDPDAVRWHVGGVIERALHGRTNTIVICKLHSHVVQPDDTNVAVFTPRRTSQ